MAIVITAGDAANGTFNAPVLILVLGREKSPEKRRIHAKSESNSLGSSLAGGGRGIRTPGTR
jgi:hypothetical protein